MLTNKILSEKLGIPITKVRRNTKEFLGGDPKAKRRSGYKREFSNNDGFFVYLGGYLVSDLGLSFDAARRALEVLKPWLLLNGFVPDIPENAIRVGIDREMKSTVKIGLWVDYDVSDCEYNFYFQVSGYRGHKIDDFHDSLGRSCSCVTTERLQYTFGTSFEDAKLKDFFKRINRKGNIEPKQIYIMIRLEHFMSSVFGTGKAMEWVEKWKALAKKDPTEAEQRIRKEMQEHDSIYYVESILPVLSGEGEISNN